MQIVSGPIGKERVHYEAPAADRVPAEMSQFLDWFNGTDSIDLVMQAALAHLWFVTIHPFDDGNGRIARTIADLALARSEQSPKRFYGMSAQIRLERADYYEILERTQKGSLDVTPWMHWFLGCLDRALVSAEVTLASVLRKARFWEAHSDESFNDRQRKVINRLLNGFEGRLTSSKWARLAKCSQDTASRDIIDLIKAGFWRKTQPVDEVRVTRSRNRLSRAANGASHFPHFPSGAAQDPGSGIRSEPRIRRISRMG